MALSSEIFSTVLCAKTTPFRTSPSLSLFLRHPDNLRMVRAVTVTSETAASEAATIKTREPRGIRKPRPVSPEMKDVVGESVIPRTQALKRIWAHIKEHDLQLINTISYDLGSLSYVSLFPPCFNDKLEGLHRIDPQNKKVIICDEKLKKIFEGKDRVGFLEIAKLIGPHFL
ncbi:hypothetical protein Bca4012_007668 [Brassica carinata]|uniref:SWIB domain-containing protein n=1 Tax=Brassica carinata TaxID=52824 RepID=A0A8X7RPG0_BRACI|nr:hypothetical protein Bca52824_038386 [Brassica carinata]